MTKTMLFIFTPTYNRKQFLERLYQSFLNQTTFEFRWLIVDDGSMDSTKKMVESWKKNCPFEIRYIFKENGGKHTAFNLALDEVQEFLNVCVDSDDTVSPRFVETILANHSVYQEKKDMISYVYPCAYGIPRFEIDINGNPKTVNSWKISNEISGIKEVIRVFKPSVLRGLRFETFVDEKFLPMCTLFVQIAKKGDSLYFPDPLVFGDYQEGGLTNLQTKLIISNPKGYVYSQRLQFDFLNQFPQKRNLRNKIKIVAQMIAFNVALKRHVFLDLPHTKLRFIALPIGVLYSFKRYGR